MLLMNLLFLFIDVVVAADVASIAAASVVVAAESADACAHF